MRRLGPPRMRPPATLGLRNPNQARTERSIPPLTCAGIFNRRSARGESVESPSTSSKQQQQQQPPAISTAAPTPASSASASKTSTLPPAPVRSPPPPSLSRKQERELRAAIARRERAERESGAGPVIIEVVVERGDTVESLAKKTGLPAETIAAVAAEAAAEAASQGKEKGNQDTGDQQKRQERLVLVPGTSLEFESPFLITPEVTAAVLELDRIAKSEKLTKEMADRQRDELVASLREQDRAMGAQAAAAARGGGVGVGGHGRALGMALDVLLLFAAVSAAVVAAAASMGVVAALQKRSIERKAAAMEEERAAAAAARAAAAGGEEEEGGEGQEKGNAGRRRRTRDWKQVVAETGRAAAEEAAAEAAEAEEAEANDDLPAAVPAWALGKAVWRVRMASGVAEAAVPLPPRPQRRSSSASSSSSSSSRRAPPPPPPDLVWLAFEEEKDAEAWARWLTAPGGPLSEPPSSPKSSRSSSSSLNIPVASVVRAAPEQLHGAAKEAGRALAFVPSGAFRPLPRPGEPQRLVLPRLAKAAHPQRCGVDLLLPAERAAAVETAKKVHGWAPTSGSVAADVAEEYDRTMAMLEREAREKREREEAREEEEEEEREKGDAIEVEVEKEISPPPPKAAATPAETTNTAAAAAAAPLLPGIPNSVSMENLDLLRAAARGETETQRRIRAGEPVVFADDDEVASAVPGPSPFSDSSPHFKDGNRGKGGDFVVVDPLARALGAARAMKSSPEPTFDAIIVGHVGQRFWYRGCPEGTPFAVPVMDLGGGTRGLLELEGILPAGFDAGFGFGDDDDEEDDDDDDDIGGGGGGRGSGG